MFIKKSTNAYVLLFTTATFLALTANITFFSKTMHAYPVTTSAGFLVSLGIVITGILLLLFTITAYKWTLKPIVIFFLMAGAASAYFTDTYSTILDVAMLENALQTDTAESKDLLSMAMGLRLLLLGVLPSIIVYLTPVYFPKVKFSFIQRAASLLLAIVMIGAPLAMFSKSYASFFREHKPLRYYVNPITPIYSLGKLLSDKYQAATEPKTLSTQATDIYSTGTHEKPELVVMIVGETARSDHFSLNGYARNTNPLLAKQKNLYSYTDVTSCGTSTAYSVPCMFSFDDRSDYDVKAANFKENVLDKLAQSGVRVLWRDNNSDSKGVATRVAFEDYKTPKNNTICDASQGGECRDEGMLVGLPEYITQKKQDTMIVLHQMGNHGPAYYKRYPKAFEQFTPVCKTNELAKCDAQSIINAYDNAILYTDFFINKTIEMLKPFTKDFEVTLVYMSDHGESLGEKGVYLHGMPYAFAPIAQTKVPLMVWVGEGSDVMLDSIDTKKETSHDAITPTLVRLFELNTKQIHKKDGFFEVSETAHL